MGARLLVPPLTLSPILESNASAVGARLLVPPLFPVPILASQQLYSLGQAAVGTGFEPV